MNDSMIDSSFIMVSVSAILYSVLK